MGNAARPQRAPLPSRPASGPAPSSFIWRLRRVNGAHFPGSWLRASRARGSVRPGVQEVRAPERPRRQESEAVAAASTLFYGVSPKENICTVFFVFFLYVMVMLLLKCSASCPDPTPKLRSLPLCYSKVTSDFLKFSMERCAFADAIQSKCFSAPCIRGLPRSPFPQ